MKDTRIIKTEKKDNYSVISNECFRNPQISAKAKGIFAYLMTLPYDWKIRKGEIYTHFPEGRCALDSGFKELETNGYITQKQTRDDKSRYKEVVYTIYEKSINSEDRDGNKYRLWRRKVFLKDNYTCTKCNKRDSTIQAHHIKSWRDYPEERFNIDNGITLCFDCHSDIHPWMKKENIK